jgi:hypothetical protein
MTPAKNNIAEFLNHDKDDFRTCLLFLISIFFLALTFHLIKVNLGLAFGNHSGEGDMER